MASVKDFQTGKRNTMSSISSRSEPVYFISDQNQRLHLDSDTDVNGRRESQISKLDKMEKQKFISIPDRRVIDRSTFARLKNKAIVVTTEDRRKIAEGLMADREKLENESLARKQKLQSYDILRTKGKQLAQVSDTYNKKIQKSLNDCII